jgi:hypothetical protein
MWLRTPRFSNRSATLLVIAAEAAGDLIPR